MQKREQALAGVVEAASPGSSRLALHEAFRLVLSGQPLQIALDAVAGELEALAGPDALCMIVVRNVDDEAAFCKSTKGCLPENLAILGVSTSVFPQTRLRMPSTHVITSDAEHAALSLRVAAAGYRAALLEPVPSPETGKTVGLVALFCKQTVEQFAFLGKEIEQAAQIAGMLAQTQDVVSTVNNADKRFSALAATIPGVLYQRAVHANGDIRYTYISENAFDLFGVTAERILNDPEALFRHYSPEYRSSFRTRLLKASKDLSLWDVEATILRPDGQTRYTHAIARPQLRPDGSVLWTGVILDATRIKEAELATAAAEIRTREAIVESLSQGLLMFDRDDVLTIRNSHFDLLYPAMAKIAVPGAQYLEIIRAELDPSINPDVTSFDANDELVDRLMRHGEPHLVYEREMADDRFILVNEYRTPNAETVVLYTDISEMKRRERKIEHLAHHDALTGLANRVLFRDRLQDALGKGEIDNKRVAVMCLDLDRFKTVNDTLGHQIGDRLLQQVASRLSDSLRGDDVPCRLGGDEFAIIIPDVGDGSMLTSMAWRILNALAQPFDLDGHSVVSGTSIGIAVAGQDGSDAESLLKNADLALYRAKTDGRGTFRYFETDMDSRAQARRSMEMALRGAIAHQELEVHYQPLVDTHTSHVMGAEALVRWKRGDMGYVPPLDFIPLAEETGLITVIGEWVLRQACTDAIAWPSDVRIAVNISPAQFRNPAFAEVVEGILVETGLPADRLELEITESMLLRNTEANLKILHQLKALGIRISMDDFGTGYSSLGNLRSFPFDKIKIDKSFIGDLNKSADAAAIIRAVLALGRSLGMTTTAEGVETRDQLAYLRAEGCVEVQGHYFARALTAMQMIHALSSNGTKLSPAQYDREIPLHEWTADLDAQQAAVIRPMR